MKEAFPSERDCTPPRCPPTKAIDDALEAQIAEALKQDDWKHALILASQIRSTARQRAAMKKLGMEAP